MIRSVTCEAAKALGVPLAATLTRSERSNAVEPSHGLEIIADNLKKEGWSYGYVSMIDSNGRTIWIVDAHIASP
jgi:hypothetical protein